MIINKIINQRTNKFIEKRIQNRTKPFNKKKFPQQALKPYKNRFGEK
jgi:hypothetical protein